jgi:N,N'-diacetyllegionaminate synthase
MRTLVIAEAGVNHNGDMGLARRLIDAAAEAGADYVKFQTFNATHLVTRSAKKAEYQIKATDDKQSQYEMLKALELNPEAHEMLMAHCAARSIRFFSTAFDPLSLEFLHALKLGLYKVPSGEITNLPFLRNIGAQRCPVILSTGMATMAEVEAAIGVLIDAGTSRDQITVLHCTTEYPAPMADVNLRAMLSIRDQLRVAVGYSDHTQGIEVPIAAVALGATVIEKHLTLDRSLPGPDHAASLEPDEFRAMVSAIRNIELALGDGIKQPSASEKANLTIARKSIVAARAILAGERFSEENIVVKRPGLGISPMRWDEVVGSVACRNFAADELIDL